MRAVSLEVGFLWLLAASMLAAAEFHVAANGSATGTGSAGLPFRSLERARQAVAEAKQAGLGKEAVVVWIHGGRYERNEPFELGPADGGSPGAPVIYRSIPGEQPVLSGAVSLPLDAFQRVADSSALARLRPEARKRVRALDLNALRIADYGQLPPRLDGTAPAMELYYGGERMEPARWPNHPDWTVIGRVLDQGTTSQDAGPPRAGTFRYADPRHAQWAGAQDAYLYGYWCFDHTAEAIRIERIDPAARTLELAAPHAHGIGRGTTPRRYYAFNLLEELDCPGEYYLDRSKGMLYLWPPKGKDKTVHLAMLSEPLVRVANATDLRIEGIVFEHVRGNAVEVAGCERISLAGCTVRHTGSCGISVDGGRDCRIDSCDVYDSGGDGIRMAGGDPRTLAPSEHRATNNHIHHVGRRRLTDTTAIRLRGVGLRADHNLIHDAPQSAILCAANDCAVEYNEMHSVCLEADGCGAFEEGGNPTRQGTVLRYNLWHHIGMPPGRANHAIRLHDGQLGTTVFGNVLYRTGGMAGAAFVDGGYANVFENNLFIECDRGIGHARWSDEKWRDRFDPARNELARKHLHEDVDIANPVYAERYQSLRDFPSSWQRPRRNTAGHNVAVRCGSLLGDGEFQATGANLELADDPGFANPRKLDFLLDPGSTVFSRLPEFRPIPFSLIGLRRGPWRGDLPVRQQPEPRDAPPRPSVPDIPLDRFAIHPGITPTVDGELREWSSGEESIPMRENLFGRPCQLPSRAWLRWDREALYVAFENPVSPAKPLQTGDEWGRCDGVEVALAQGNARTTILRGYATGHFAVTAKTTKGENDPDPVGEGVAYAVQIVSPELWTCEWSIPWAILAAPPQRGGELNLNLCVRKTAQDEWVLLRATGAETWAAGEAAVLVLSGTPRAAVETAPVASAVPSAESPAAAEPNAPATASQSTTTPPPPSVETESTEEENSTVVPAPVPPQPPATETKVARPEAPKPEPPPLKPPVKVAPMPTPAEPARLGPPIPAEPAPQQTPPAEPPRPEPPPQIPPVEVAPVPTPPEPARVAPPIAKEPAPKQTPPAESPEPEPPPLKPPVKVAPVPAPAEPAKLGPPIPVEPAPKQSPPAEPAKPEPPPLEPPAKVAPVPAPAEPAPQQTPPAEPPKPEPPPLKPPIKVAPEPRANEPLRLGPPIPPKAVPDETPAPKPEPPKPEPPKPEPPKPEPAKPEPAKPEPAKPAAPPVAPPIVVHPETESGEGAMLGPPLPAKPPRQPADMPPMRISPPEKLVPTSEGKPGEDSPAEAEQEPKADTPQPRARRWLFWGGKGQETEQREDEDAQ